MAEPHESRVYSDLAHFYDKVFGRAFVDHEHEVIESLPFRPGQRALEVGVGTGISLDAYPPYLRIVGIDPSDKMLAQAVAKTRENDWGHVELKHGDAQQLEFPDDSFDWVLSFHVMTVVPDPRRMMAEMVRVCRPGGKIVVISHFASPNALLYLLGRLVNPLTKLLGWTTRLRARDVLEGQPIEVERHDRFSAISVHYCIIARKSEMAARRAS
jgi:phosphatidylethanolamine/phosphatidyl-N-methylethanolamine N-methyltransferase